MEIRVGFDYLSLFEVWFGIYWKKVCGYVYIGYIMCFVC